MDAGYQKQLCCYVVRKEALLAKLQTAYKWMTELVHQDTGLKKLKQLQVVEGPMMEGTQILAWSPPAGLLSAFETAGVEFELRIACGHLPPDKRHGLETGSVWFEYLLAVLIQALLRFPSLSSTGAL